MTATSKRPLISESVAAIQIDIHPAREEPDQHVLLSQNRAPALWMKTWLLAIVLPGRHPGLPHSPSNKRPRSREVWFDKVVTGLLGLLGPIKSDMRPLQVKAFHRGQNDAVINRHKPGLPPWNLGIATVRSPPFPSKCSTFS
jgi:hypothetical protein